jgi:hypothetical protein
MTEIADLREPTLAAAVARLIPESLADGEWLRLACDLAILAREIVTEWAQNSSRLRKEDLSDGSEVIGLRTVASRIHGWGDLSAEHNTVDLSRGVPIRELESLAREALMISERDATHRSWHLRVASVVQCRVETRASTHRRPFRFSTDLMPCFAWLRRVIFRSCQPLSTPQLRCSVSCFEILNRCGTASAGRTGRDSGPSCRWLDTKSS